MPGPPRRQRLAAIEQEVVNAATTAGARGASGQAAAQGSAAAAAQKNAPKPLQTKTEKQAAVNGGYSVFTLPPLYLR